jgi:hypothetical protein
MQRSTPYVGAKDVHLLAVGSAGTRRTVPRVTESADQIVARVFDRARADELAAPLADALGQAYHAGMWTVGELDRRAQEVTERLSRPDTAPATQEEPR